MNKNIYSGIDGGDLAGRKQDILFLFVERSRRWKNDIEVKEHELSRDLSSYLVCAKFRKSWESITQRRRDLLPRLQG